MPNNDVDDDDDDVHNGHGDEHGDEHGELQQEHKPDIHGHALGIVNGDVYHVQQR